MGSQLVVIGREGRAAPSWAAWRCRAAPDQWPVTVGMGLLDGWAGWGGGWAGLRLLVCGLLGWSLFAGYGARLA